MSPSFDDDTMRDRPMTLFNPCKNKSTLRQVPRFEDPVDHKCDSGPEPDDCGPQTGWDIFKLSHCTSCGAGNDEPHYDNCVKTFGHDATSRYSKCAYQFACKMAECLGECCVNFYSKETRLFDEAKKLCVTCDEPNCSTCEDTPIEQKNFHIRKIENGYIVSSDGPEVYMRAKIDVLRWMNREMKFME